MYNYIIKTEKPSKMKIAELKNEIEEINDILRKNSTKDIELDKKKIVEIKIRLSQIKAAYSEKTLKERLDDMNRKEKEKERKNRTHRLVQIGGIIEMYFPNMTENEMYRLLEFIVDQDERGGYASKKIGRDINQSKIAEIKNKLSGKPTSGSHEEQSAPNSFY